jgi:hypothetical protein
MELNYSLFTLFYGSVRFIVTLPGILICDIGVSVRTLTVLGPHSQLHEKSVDNSLVSMELNYSLFTLLYGSVRFIVTLPGNPNM